MTPIAQTESAQAAGISESKAVNKQAQDQNQAKLREACQMFEAMFLNLLWKEMRRTVDKSGVMHGGFAEDMFTNMMDEAVSQASANEGSMGIADMLERQLNQMSGVRPGGQLGQKTKPLAREGEAQAGSYDQTKAAGAALAAWQAPPENSERGETTISKWY